MGSFTESLLEVLVERMEELANMSFAQLIMEFCQRSAKLAMQERGMGLDGPGEVVAVDGVAVEGEGVPAPAASEEEEGVTTPVVEGMGLSAMEIEEDGEGLAAADGVVMTVDGEGVVAAPAERKFRGVRPQKRGIFDAEIHMPIPIGNSKRVWLGSFGTAEEAAWAYDTAAWLVWDERAKTNFPQPPPMPIPTSTCGLLLSYFDITRALREQRLAKRRRGGGEIKQEGRGRGSPGSEEPGPAQL
ncbi:hypothetical protein ABZP36_020790 [Zizania latifolia]